MADSLERSVHKTKATRPRSKTGGDKDQGVFRAPSNPSTVGQGVELHAAQGLAGSGGLLPHAEAIQRSFGHHDISGVRAHTGGAAKHAAQALGAEAYAMGEAVAFQRAPSLHTAAHEAAHVVQQRGGVQLKGGVGEVGDRYEQNADAVADAVVRGDSAQGLLDPFTGGGGGAVVQRKPLSAKDPSAEAPEMLGAEAQEADPVADPVVPTEDTPALERHPDSDEDLPPPPQISPEDLPPGSSMAPDDAPVSSEAVASGSDSPQISPAEPICEAPRSEPQSQMCEEAPLCAPAPMESKAPAKPKAPSKPKSGPPVAFRETLRAGEGQGVQRGLQIIELTQTAAHTRTFVNPELLKALPHKTKGGPRRAAFGDVLKALETQGKLKKALAKQQERVEKQRRIIKNTSDKEGAAHKEMGRLREKPKTTKKGACKRLKRVVSKLQKKRLKQTERLEALRTAADKKHAELKRVTESLKGLAVEARAKLLKLYEERISKEVSDVAPVVARRSGVLQRRREQLQKQHDKGAALREQLPSLREAWETLKGKRETLKTLRALRKKTPRKERGELTKQIKALNSEASQGKVGKARKRYDKAKGALKRLKTQIKDSEGKIKTVERELDKIEAKRDAKIRALRAHAEEAKTLPILTEFSPVDYKGEIEGQQYKLTTHAAGHPAQQRPMGFGNGGRVPLTRKMNVDAIRKHLGIIEDQPPTKEQQKRLDLAVGMMDALSKNEGRTDSVNTWDTAILTFGAGLTSAGVLQRAMWALRTGNPEDFEQLFGRFGVDIHKEDKGRPFLSVVDPEGGRRLKGKDAQWFIANSPKLLVAFRHAGRNQAWQLAQAQVMLDYSVMMALVFRFSVTLPASKAPEGSPKPEASKKKASKKKGSGKKKSGRVVKLSLRAVLDGTGWLQGAALAAVADVRHLSGGKPKQRVSKLFMEYWSTQLDKNKWDESRRPILSDETIRTNFAKAVFKLTPKNRQKTIAQHFKGDHQ